MAILQIQTKEGTVMARKNIKKLETYASETTAAGLTYGQKQQQEYAAAVKISPIPEGYRKVGEFTRKKWEEDL